MRETKRVSWFGQTPKTSGNLPAATGKTESPGRGAQRPAPKKQLKIRSR